MRRVGLLDASEAHGLVQARCVGFERTKPDSIESPLSEVETRRHQPSSNAAAPRLWDDIKVTESPDRSIVEVRVDVEATHPHTGVSGVSHKESFAVAIKPVCSAQPFHLGSLHEGVPLSRGQLSQTGQIPNLPDDDPRDCYLCYETLRRLGPISIPPLISP